ncbi:MAG: hypothetical protein Q9157_002225 [Trypethelium eluteriae]
MRNGYSTPRAEKSAIVLLLIEAKQQKAIIRSPPEWRARQDSELNGLRQELENSLSNVQRYLSLGWIGVYEVLHAKNLSVGCMINMDNLLDLWHKFHSSLLQLQRLILELKKTLMFWEKVLYALLLISHFSEFPNRLRPPCTTMPWTIWPALVVLWGVCWMFYEPFNRDWEPPVFEDEIFGARFSGNLFPYTRPGKKTYDLPDLGTVLSSFDHDVPELRAYDFDLLGLEQQLQQSIPEPATCLRTPRSTDFIPTSAPVKPPDNITLPVSAARTTSISPYQAVGAPREAAEARQPEATESQILATPDVSTSINAQPPDGAWSTTTDSPQTKPSRNSKHGQIERYLCCYPDCSRSRQGSGFSRKDHLDQHLRGPHKQSSVERVRAKSAAASSSRSTAAMSRILQPLPQSKKRKRGGDGELDAHNVEELAEERRMRMVAEQENQQLRLMVFMMFMKLIQST